jgi:large subunit ribosomal protein L18
MEHSLKGKIKLRAKRSKRVRKQLKGTAQRPRLSVKISNKHVYAQLIDDQKGITLASASSLKAEGKKGQVVETVGEQIATQAKEKEITKAVFDRGCRKYHGLVAKLAEKAREVGLQF